MLVLGADRCLTKLGQGARPSRGVVEWSEPISVAYLRREGPIVVVVVVVGKPGQPDTGQSAWRRMAAVVSTTTMLTEAADRAVRPDRMTAQHEPRDDGDGDGRGGHTVVRFAQ